MKYYYKNKYNDIKKKFRMIGGSNTDHIIYIYGLEGCPFYSKAVNFINTKFKDTKLENHSFTNMENVREIYDKKKLHI